MISAYNHVRYGLVGACRDHPDITDEHRNLNTDAEAITRGLIADAVLLDITNVAEYLLRDGTKFALMRPGVDGLIPPWPITWVEWQWPAVFANSPHRHMGFLLYHSIEDDHHIFVGHENQNEPHRVAFVGPYLMVRGMVIGPLSFGSWYLTDQGELTNYLTYVNLPWGIALDSRSEWEDQSHSQKGFDFAQTAINTAFRFANCRNVERVEVAPNRQQRRLDERSGQASTVHYVLEIGASTQRRAIAQGAQDESAKRLHICRGHFATYTESAPLFGKHTGRFWIPAHVRGNARAGVVSKTYTIDTKGGDVDALSA